MEDTTFLTGTVFLVRHAEKYPGRDSTLTPEGLLRAGRLYRLLKDSGIQKIYTTPYRRAVQTADSLRLRLHLDTAYYRADTTGESLIYEISRRDDWGKRLLVVGHSNTLLPILYALRARVQIDSIGDQEFGYLFIVQRGRKSTKVQVSHY
ncbi:histidine phosphatase family protein [Chitinophaga pendula]|uniref:SixA phosphatase family protein n=1 Tax=Chitinophaga TaxID=79328 RepID=UPI0012FE098F|nr:MULTISPECIES: histidine phosphatase family protein [Chitinophaga]UCJ05354.1 histidine phosphatase family protein [Chitinophaga pendula]